MNHKTDMQAALQACVDAMLHDGVPTDPYHPRRVALNAAEAALASRPDAQAGERYDLLQAAVNCPHEIESNRVVLHYSDKQPGHNALAQLRERLARTAAPQAEAAQGVAAPSLYFYGDHEHGFECPDDAAIISGRKVGDRYTLNAAWYAEVQFEVTKVPDETSDDYEVREVIATPSPDREQAACSAPFTTDVPQCCGEPKTCNDPCGHTSPSRECGERQGAMSPERFIADNLTASERADGRLMNLIVLAWEASARTAASAPTPSGQCVHTKGIIGDEGGTPCCPITMTPDASAPTPTEPAQSPTSGMTLGERIAHVGGRTNAAGYVEFGSPMAVDALIRNALRDAASAPTLSNEQINLISEKWSARWSTGSAWNTKRCIDNALREACTLIAADAPPLGETNTDSIAVDTFAQAMKEKMADAHAKGRSGWEGMSPSDLSRMLREHVEKGDPRDVANFCMMLWHHSARIAPQPQAAEPKGLTGFDVALNALDEYQHNWDTGLPSEYAQSERTQMECACDAVREALLAVKGE